MLLNVLSIITMVRPVNEVTELLECQRLNSGTNLRECEYESWFKVQAVSVFRFDCSKMFLHSPGGYSRLKTTDLYYIVYSDAVVV
jgi:hypothetical protein